MYTTLHGVVVGACIRDPRAKTSYVSWFFWGQASSTEQLDQSNLIIFTLTWSNTAV
jgi:hypothetical protein